MYSLIFPDRMNQQPALQLLIRQQPNYILTDANLIALAPNESLVQECTPYIKVLLKPLILLKAVLSML